MSSDPSRHILQRLLADLLISMRGAVDNIQQDALHKGFTGDVNDAGAVLDFLADYDMSKECYAYLYANGAVIADCDLHVQRYGDTKQRAEAAKLAAFDYST